MATQIDVRSLALALEPLLKQRVVEKTVVEKTVAEKTDKNAIYDKLVSKAVDLWFAENPGKDREKKREELMKVKTVGLSGLNTGIAMRYMIQALNATSRKNGWIKNVSRFDFKTEKIRETKASYTADEQKTFQKYLHSVDVKLEKV